MRLRIVQANIPQKLKWDAGERETNLLRHVQLSRTPGHETRDLIIWPETASTFAVRDGAPVTQVIGRAVSGEGPCFDRRPPSHGCRRHLPSPFNSLVAVDSEANVQGEL